MAAELVEVAEAFVPASLCALELLPVEVFEKIFVHLSARDALRFEQSSTTMRRKIAAQFSRHSTINIDGHHLFQEFFPQLEVAIEQCRQAVWTMTCYLSTRMSTSTTQDGRYVDGLRSMALYGYNKLQLRGLFNLQQKWTSTCVDKCRQDRQEYSAAEESLIRSEQIVCQVLQQIVMLVGRFTQLTTVDFGRRLFADFEKKENRQLFGKFLEQSAVLLSLITPSLCDINN